MDYQYKEVYFDKYCRVCEYEKNSEKDDPCYDCLHEAVNSYSHKPINFKQRGE